MRKKEILKKGISFALVAAMGASLCACGGGKSSDSSEPKHFYSVEYPKNLPAAFSNDLGNVKIFGDNVIYQSYNEDYTVCSVYQYNIVEQTEKMLWEGTSEQLEDGTTIKNSSVSYFAVDDDNSIYLYVYQSNVTEECLNRDYSATTYDDVIERIMEMWGETEDAAIQEWNNWISGEYTAEDGTVDYAKFMKDYGLEWESTERLLKVDENGNTVYEKVVRETNPNEEGQWTINCNGIYCDGNGNLYVMMNKWSNDGTSDEYYVDVYDSEGNSLGKIELDGYVSNFIRMPNGNVAIGDYSGDHYVLREIDVNTMTVSEEGIEGFDGSLESGATAYGEDELLIRENGSLSICNMKTHEREKLLNFMDYNIPASSVNSFGILSDGRIAVFSGSYSNTQMKNVYDLAILTEIDESEMPKTEKINVACMWLDSTVESMAIEFNKKHEGYHISITEYNDPDAETYEDMLRSFTTAVAADKSIDMVIFNDYSQVVNFASKGLMTDLYQFLDNDTELTRDDLMPNVLTACEMDGKLVCLPTSFSIQTVVGKASDVGTTPGWTFDEMKALLDSKPQGTQLFYGMTRSQALQLCLNLGYKSYIDSATATCHFDTPEFVAALEFANMFPEEFEGQEDEDSSVLMNEGKVLLSEFYLNDFAEIQMYEAVFNDKLTYIGYPTTEGNGAMISLNNIYGITKNCKHPDIAWEFLRQFYLPTDNENDEYSYGFSVRKDGFEKFCENAQKPLEDGGWTWGWGNFEVEIHPATDEEIAAIKDLVYNATAVNGAVTNEIMNIINEEAAYYFSGEQSAEAVADKIQSRMQIYLSETK